MHLSWSICGVHKIGIWSALMRMAKSIPKRFDQFTLPPAATESSGCSTSRLGIVFHSSCSDRCVLTSHHVFNWLPFCFFPFQLPIPLWSSWAFPDLFIIRYHEEHLKIPSLQADVLIYRKNNAAFPIYHPLMEESLMQPLWTASEHTLPEESMCLFLVCVIILFIYALKSQLEQTRSWRARCLHNKR